MPQLSRRAFASALPLSLMGGSLLAGGLIGGAPALATTQTAAKAPVSVTPLAQIRIGRFTVTALTDGYADMPYDYFPGRSADEVEKAAVAQFTARQSGVRFLFNQYLIEDGERRILIDAGAAGSIGQTGALPMALGTLGLQPDQIDAVIVTHMHQDHMGGLILGGKNNYPNAEVYIDRRDVKHWTDPAKRSGAPDFLQTSFTMADEVVRLYPKLQAIDGEREIAWSHPAAIVRHADERQSPGRNDDLDVRGSGIDGVFDELFHDARRTLDHLARSNSVDRLWR